MVTYEVEHKLALANIEANIAGNLGKAYKKYVDKEF